MTDLEVNKIIIDFMQIDHTIPTNLDEMSEKQLKVFLPFTRSLDVLVPVWEKMKAEYGTEMIMGIQIFDYNGKPWNCEFETQEPTDKHGSTGICIEHPSNSAFKSAAYATAEAILKLTNSSEATISED